jgi:hypothetical protein
MNCDEYYSYNALAGLVSKNDEEPAKKWDPWELVTEAVNRMKRNGDVMRSDRLKQVMQEIDSTFDEKDLGMAKFSRFVQDAVQRGLLSATKLENGQLEIGLPSGAKGDLRAAENAAADEAARGDGSEVVDEKKREGGRSRRGRRGRGRDREDRGPRADRAPEVPLDGEAAAMPQSAAPVHDVVATSEVIAPSATPSASPRGRGGRPDRGDRQPRVETPARAESGEQIGVGGERLTRDEAFDLVRRSVAALTKGDEAVRAGVVRAKARELLGRDSESLSDRNFPRILKDAHDGDVIDLRRRGDDFEIARAAEAESVSEQLAKTAIANAPTPTAAPAVPRGMGARGVSGPRGRAGRPGAPPPELLSIGVVGPSSSAAASAAPTLSAPSSPSATTAPTSTAVSSDSPEATLGKPRAKKTAAKKSVAAKKSPAAKKAPAAKKPRAKKVAAAHQDA